MSNTFCRFLSNGYSYNLVNNQLKVKPCCWYNGDHTREYLQSVTGWTSGCEVCQKQELSGYHSFRQASFDIVPDLNDHSIVALDIAVDFNCNAACVMCGPEFSSTWSKHLDNLKVIHIAPKFDSPVELPKLDLTNLRRIKFFGGEPLLTDLHTNILKQIENPEQVEIWYTTNASILPSQEVLDLWGKFKLVFLEASIDGVGEQFEYIRWPLVWTRVEENLLKLKQIGPNNLLFRINHTLNPFNIYYYDRLETWFNQNLATNRLGDASEINIHPCWGNWGLDKTPLALRTVVAEKYKEHSISSILSQVELSDSQPISKFTQTWDPIRKNDWRKVFPDIVKYFDQ